MISSQFNTTFIKEAMGAFTAILLPITALSFATSEQAASPGDVIKVPYATNMSSSGVFDYTNGYQGDSNSIGVKSVTLDNLVYQKFSLTDTDAAKLSSEAVTTLARQAGERLANDVISQSIATTVTNTNFPTSASVTYGQLTSSLGFVELVTQADNAKWTQDNRNLILTPDAWGSLLKNSDIAQAFSYGGSQVIQNALPEKVYGFNTFKTTVDLPNGCKGLVLNPNSILTAFGVHKPSDQGKRYVETQTATDKQGITISMRTWYDPDLATTKYVLECLFGNEVGNSSKLLKKSHGNLNTSG